MSELTPAQVAKVARLYDEYQRLSLELGLSAMIAQQGGVSIRDDAECTEKARAILNDFLPRYRDGVPIPVQVELSVIADSLEKKLKDDYGI